MHWREHVPGQIPTRNIPSTQGTTCSPLGGGHFGLEIMYVHMFPHGHFRIVLHVEQVSERTPSRSRGHFGLETTPQRNKSRRARGLGQDRNTYIPPLHGPMHTHRAILPRPQKQIRSCTGTIAALRGCRRPGQPTMKLFSLQRWEYPKAGLTGPRLAVLLLVRRTRTGGVPFPRPAWSSAGKSADPKSWRGVPREPTEGGKGGVVPGPRLDEVRLTDV